MSKRERWFDEGDFTGWHDLVSNSLATKPEKWAMEIARVAIDESTVISAELKDLQMEPLLEGYPTVFPDALGTLRTRCNHRSIPLKQTRESNQVLLQCSARNCPCWDVGKYPQPSIVYWKEDCTQQIKIVFEFKERIESLGSVLRQINIYRSRSSAVAFLVTEDFRYEEAFLNQRIFLIKPWF